MDQSYQSWFENNLEPYVQIEKAHLNSIECCCFNTQNPNELATGAHDKLIKIWDINKLKTINTLEGHQQGVWAVNYSQDGKTLLSGSPDKMLMLWDIKKQKPMQVLKEHKNKIYWATFNETSKLIASGGEDQRLIIWDLRKCSPLKIIQTENPIIYCVKWSKCGKYLFCSEYGGIVKVYDTQKFDLLDTYGTFQEKDKAWSCDMDFRDNIKVNSQIFVGHELKRYLRVLNFDKKKNKITFGYDMDVHLQAVKNIKFFGEKNLLVTSCRDGSARIWQASRQSDQKKNVCIANLLGHRDNISCADFAPSNSNPSVLATVSWDQSLNIYQLQI